MATSSQADGDWRAAQLRRLYRGIFHEASNPIGGALGCLQAAQSGLIEANELPDYLDAVQDGLRRVQRLTAAYHRFVLPSEDISRPVDLKSAIDDAYLLIKKDAAEARITLANAAEPAMVHGGSVACLQISLHCLQALLDRQATQSTLAAEVSVAGASTRLVFSGTALAADRDFHPGPIGAVAALCAVHGASVDWDDAGNRVVIDWASWMD